VNLTVTVLQIVAPVFLLASIGFIWVKVGLEYRIQFVTQLAMTLSLPCLIFVSLMQTRIDPAALTALSLASVMAYALISIAFLALVRLLRLPSRTYTAPLIFGNTGNLGLPLALFAFGDIGLSYAIIVFAVMALWSYTYGIWLVAGAGSLGKVLREPLVWATVFGALFMWQGKRPNF
jgi:predicted permease